MARTEIKFTVDSVKVEQGSSFVPHYGQGPDPVELKLVGHVEDGTKVYANVKVANHGYIDAGGGGHIEYYAYRPEEELAHKNGGLTWTLPMEREVEILSNPRFQSAWAFHGNFPVSAIWRDDVLTVKASVVHKVSVSGNPYLSLLRVSLVGVERDGTQLHPVQDPQAVQSK